MVKDLRDKTGAGMMDLQDRVELKRVATWKLAIDWLRKKGISKAAKKAGRCRRRRAWWALPSARPIPALLVEVNAETDFVARNEEFKGFVKSAAAPDIALAGRRRSGEAAAGIAKHGGSTVQQTLTELVAKIGENMSVRRTIALSVNPGVVGAYVHNASSPELGKIGVLVALKSSADEGKLSALAKQIAMHVAAASPLALTEAHIPKDVKDREYAIQKELALQSGKPEAVVEKMMVGRMRKYFEETVL